MVRSHELLSEKGAVIGRTVLQLSPRQPCSWNGRFLPEFSDNGAGTLLRAICKYLAAAR